MKERIQKLLSAAGVDSRRHIEEMVTQGRVAVNGKIMTRLPILVDPAVDKVMVDGENIRLGRRRDEPLVYVLVNKPKNVYSTNVPQGEQRLLIDLLPRDFPRVYPVGRLDHDARGLILLSNDGELTHQLTHPKFGIAKSYRAIVDGSVTGETLEKLKRGVWLADPKTRTGFKASASSIRIVDRNPRHTILDITVREGRNSQIRRMMAHFGHKVRDLLRTKFGPLTLEGTGNGKWRLLSPGEIKKLKTAIERGEQAQPAEKPGKKRRPGGFATVVGRKATSRIGGDRAGPGRPPANRAPKSQPTRPPQPRSQQEGDDDADF